MNVEKRMRFVVALVGVIVVVYAGVAQAELFQYQAGENITPTDQGWTAEAKNGGSAADYNLEDGGGGWALHMNTTGAVGKINSWVVDSNTGFDFTSSDKTIIEAGIQVNSTNGSGYAVDAGRWRAGYSLAMTDKNNNHVILGISTDGVRLTTNNVTWAEADSSAYVTDGVTPTDPTVYRLVAQNSVFELFVDGVSTLTLDLGAVHTEGNRADTFRFGDISTLAGSDTWVSWVNASTVPEPSSLLLFAGMMGFGMVCYRRRKQQQ